MPLKCRFYEQRFPEVEDVVMCSVRSIADMGAYVDLLEYKDIEGMILLSELSRRRIRSINKLIRVGRSECVVVIRVDKDKGYIDLSKRRVSEEDIVKCEEKYARAKTVNSILTHSAAILNFETDEQLEELYNNTAWYFDRKYGKVGSCFDAFKLCVSNPAALDECGLEEQTKKVVIDNIKRRMTPQAVKIRADIDVACYQYEGIDAVKNALRAGLNYSQDEFPIKINLIAPPLYVVTTQTLERPEGLEKLQGALDIIKETIEKSGGIFAIKVAPKVVSDTEEQELEKRLEDLESANREIAGDDDQDSYGEEEIEDDVDEESTVIKESEHLENGEL